MARLARLVVPGLPHHVTQRGNRRERVFFDDDDYRAYLALIAGAARKSGTEVWAYCLMPNHVHLILTPSTGEGLALAVGEAHRRYTNYINARSGWTGHLFQSRFASVAMDEDHLMAAVRYVALNPVRAKLAARARDWRWSSTRAHLAGEDDTLVTVAPILARTDRFADLLETTPDGDLERFAALRRAEMTGRPVGAPGFVADLERRLGRVLTPARRGRPKGVKAAGAEEEPKRV
jgi:putative transposase